MPDRGSRGAKGEVLWRLEAFDLRAGLAFATCREEQTSAQVVRDWPCLFFAPPDFAAEPVDNVAAALAATRGCFDSDLLVKGREASFRTPADVAEFVRRAYVSSAGGDGSDGPRGGEPLPPSPEGPPEPPPIDGGQLKSGNAPEAVGALLGAIGRNRAEARSFSDGQSFGCTWADVLQAATAASVAAGALQLMAEMLGRLPLTGDIQDECRWLDDARSLGAAISGLGLWDVVLPHHGSALNLVHRRHPKRWVVSHRPVPEAIFSLFAFPGMPDDEWAFEHWWHRLHHSGGYVAERPADASESLAQWPVPRFALALLPKDMHDKASVENLLASFIGTPWSLERMPSFYARSVLDILIFTCASLANSRTPSPTSVGWLWHGSPSPSAMTIAAVEKRGQEGLRWLVEQLPSRIFSEGYEEVIERARDIRYRSAADDHVPPESVV